MATLFCSLAFAILLTSSTAHDTTARTIEVKHDGHNRHQPQVQPHLHTAVESAGSFDLMQQSSGKEGNLCRGPLDLIDSGCEEETSQESCIAKDQAVQQPNQPVAVCIWATPEPCQFQFLTDDTDPNADPVICHSGTCEHSHHFCTSSALSTGESCQPQCQDGYHASGEAHCSSAGSCAVGGSGGDACKVVCEQHVNAAGDAITASNSCTLHAPLNGMLGEQCSAGYLVAGRSCVPTCNAGYHVSGEFSCSSGASSGELTVATCVMDDDNTDNASCELQAPDNGSLDSAGGSHCSNELLHGSSCTPKCADGFHPLGLTRCNHGVLTNTDISGTSHGAAQCAATHHMAFENPGSCLVHSPLHGSLNGCGAHMDGNRPSLAAGGSCQIGCDVGYQVVGSTHCDSSGSGHLTHTASCAPSYSSHAGCTVLAVDHANGGFHSESTPGGSNPGGHYCAPHLPAGQTCYPRCAEGFHPSGWTSCSSSGDGTLAAATCEPNEPIEGACAVYAPHHGSLGNCGGHWTHVMAPGDSCQVQCDSGYHAVGSTICSPLGDSAEGQLHQAATCQHRSGYHGDIAQVCHVPGTQRRKDGSCDGSLTVGASCSPDSLSCNAAQGYESSTTCMASGRASAPTCVKDQAPLGGSLLEQAPESGASTATSIISNDQVLAMTDSTTIGCHLHDVWCQLQAVDVDIRDKRHEHEVLASSIDHQQGEVEAALVVMQQRQDEHEQSMQQLQKNFDAEQEKAEQNRDAQAAADYEEKRNHDAQAVADYGAQREKDEAHYKKQVDKYDAYNGQLVALKGDLAAKEKEYEKLKACMAHETHQEHCEDDETCSWTGEFCGIQQATFAFVSDNNVKGAYAKEGGQSLQQCKDRCEADAQCDAIVYHSGFSECKKYAAGWVADSHSDTAFHIYRKSAFPVPAEGSSLASTAEKKLMRSHIH